MNYNYGCDASVWDELVTKYKNGFFDGLPKIPVSSVYGRIINQYEVKKVIFNDPATIIYWDDRSKTVVKCQPGDTYDPEKGFVMAYLKKLLGNDNTFNKEIAKWVKF